MRTALGLASVTLGGRHTGLADEIQRLAAGCTAMHVVCAVPLGVGGFAYLPANPCFSGSVEGAGCCWKEAFTRFHKPPALLTAGKK